MNRKHHFVYKNCQSNTCKCGQNASPSVESFFSKFRFTFNSISSIFLCCSNVKMFSMWRGSHQTNWSIMTNILQLWLHVTISWLCWKWTAVDLCSSSSSSSAHLVFHVSVGHVWARAGVLLSSGLGRHRDGRMKERKKAERERKERDKWDVGRREKKEGAETKQ